MYDKVREPRPKNCEKIMKGGRGARRKFTFYQSVSFLEKKKILGRSQGPRLSPGPLTFVRFVRWDIRLLTLAAWSP